MAGKESPAKEDTSVQRFDPRGASDVHPGCWSTLEHNASFGESCLRDDLH